MGKNNSKFDYSNACRKDNLLACGSFGKTYRSSCQIKGQKQTVAVHMVDKDSRFQDFNHVVDTAKALMPLAHQCPNLLLCLDFNHDDSAYYIAVEWCSQADLINYLKAVHPLLISKLDLLAQCASGLTFLHSQSPPVIHGHLTPSNVLVHSQGYKDVVKLSDYGFRALLPSTESYKRFLLEKSKSVFYPPEYFVSGRVILPEADIFSLGLIMQMVLWYNGTEESTSPKTDVHNCYCWDHTRVPLGRILANDMSGVICGDMVSCESAADDIYERLTKLINSMLRPYPENRISALVATQRIRIAANGNLH